ncbi:hypothetical protein SLS62_001194 [Diatrype stigma]|uniref:Cell wall mannoprotein n=1 Tax=Diatrype stigma TaxID=117547 RepID=A0AAN9V095_9PEZI
MKFETNAALLMLLGVASARPDAVKMHKRSLVNSAKFRREVPQEHSHEKFLTGVEAALNLNNVDEVQAAVFALLGNAAAGAGAGKVEDLDCLQQRVADQAFTNAKEAGDLEGQTNALIFRTLERNTGSVGLASVACTSETAKNPEIAALQQHQDPASDGAADLNKQITLDLAVQLASIGADPQLALMSGTFEPGDPNDATGAGNTCDEADDKEGCIFTQNLLVEDATADEIEAAVAAGGAGANAGAGAANGADANAGAGADAAAGDDAAEDGLDCLADGEDDAAADPAETPAADAGNAGDDATPTATTGTDVNQFTGTVGAPPVPITSSASDRPFEVNGSTFQNIGAAAQRACDVQKNKCANAANTGALDGGVEACDAQQKECVAANSGAANKRRSSRRGAFQRL